MAPTSTEEVIVVLAAEILVIDRSLEMEKAGDGLFGVGQQMLDLGPTSRF